MHKGKVWISSVYNQDTRENKRSAWESFGAWRAEYKPPTPERDESSLLRDLITREIKVLIEHAELTGDQEDAEGWRQRLKEVPTADWDWLQKVTSLFFGEFDGVECKEIIEDRRRTVARLKQSTDESLVAKCLVDEFVAGFKRKADANRGSWGRFGQVKAGLDVFVKWYGASRSLEHLSETTVREYSAHLEKLVSDGTFAQTTAHDYQKAFQAFVRSIGEDYPNDIRIPQNLRAARLRIVAERKEPDPFTVDEVKLLLDSASARTKLYLLLMLNCGMYQGDIADLTASEVDWKSGRIIRPRSKAAREAITRGKGQPFRVNWLLWNATFDLLKEFGNREGIVLLNEKGGPLLTHKSTTRNDAIRSAYRRVIDKLKRAGKLPSHWNKTLKKFRKTGANLLEKSKSHGLFYELYLDHQSVARQNYLVSGVPVPKFDAAIKWVGSQLGV